MNIVNVQLTGLHKPTQNILRHPKVRSRNENFISSVQSLSCAWFFATPWTEPQHARPPCPSPTPRVHPNACPSSRWCHPTISSSVTPVSSCPQSFPASGSFPMISDLETPFLPLPVRKELILFYFIQMKLCRVCVFHINIQFLLFNFLPVRVIHIAAYGCSPFISL